MPRTSALVINFQVMELIMNLQKENLANPIVSVFSQLRVYFLG